MKKFNYLILFSLLLPSIAWAWTWMDLWRTPDQQGAKLLQRNKPEAAATTFKDKNWLGVANYRSGNYADALKQFNTNKSSDGQYNSGNAEAYLGKYAEAIASYDKAIALNANNNDAIANREIVKKLLKQQQQQQNQQKQNQQNNSSADNKKESKSSVNTQQNQADKNNHETKDTQQADNQSKAQDDKNNHGNQDKQQADNQSKAQKDQQQQNQADLEKKQGKQTPLDKTLLAGSQSQKTDSQQQNPATASKQQQRQDEENQRLLSRVADDPGGLLQQKFLRDYMRRHSEEDSDPGVNQ